MRIILGLIFLFFSQTTYALDTLVVGYYESPPFVETTAHGQISGVSYWLWTKGFENHHNYHYVYKSYSDELKPLSKIIEDLKNDNIDVCLNPLTITPERNEYLQFSHPFYVSNLSIAAKKNTALDRAILFIKGFFSPTFWSTIVALLFIILFFGFLVWLFERKREESDFDESFRGILHGVWWSAVTMTTVGYGDKAPKTAGGRVVAFVWMFTAIIIISSFTASITTSLTVDRMKKNPGTLYEFKTKSVGTVEGSATHTYLIEHNFRNRMIYPELTMGLQALADEKIEAFVYDEPWLRHHIENSDNFPNLEILNIRFNVDLYAYAFSTRHSVETMKQFNSNIIDIRESMEWLLLLEEHYLSEI